jgi:hypothetical protein
MHLSGTGNWRAKAAAPILALSIVGFGASAQAGADPDNPVDLIKTATPIKHVIIYRRRESQLRSPFRHL